MKNKSNKLSVTSCCRSVVCGAPSLAPHSLLTSPHEESSSHWDSVGDRTEITNRLGTRDEIGRGLLSAPYPSYDMFLSK